MSGPSQVTNLEEVMKVMKKFINCQEATAQAARCFCRNTGTTDVPQLQQHSSGDTMPAPRCRQRPKDVLDV